jgi:hypothetical protein
MFPDLRNNLKGSGSSLYECSISYSTVKCTFALRILITPSGIRDFNGPWFKRRSPRAAAQQIYQTKFTPRGHLISTNAVKLEVDARPGTIRLGILTVTFALSTSFLDRKSSLLHCLSLGSAVLISLLQLTEYYQFSLETPYLTTNLSKREFLVLHRQIQQITVCCVICEGHPMRLLDTTTLLL